MKNLIFSLCIAALPASAVMAGDVFCQSSAVAPVLPHTPSVNFQFKSPVSSQAIVNHGVGHASGVCDVVPGDAVQQFMRQYGANALQMQQWQQAFSALGLVNPNAQQYGYPGGHGNPQQAAGQVYRNVPFANAPYIGGTTAYGVRSVDVDAFGPEDVRQIFAEVARYSRDASTGANDLMGNANQLANRIAAAVQSQSSDAVEVARITAEGQSNAQALALIIQALEAMKPQKKTSVSVTEQVPTVVPELNEPVGPIDVGQLQTGGLVQDYCGKCHGVGAVEIQGNFRLGRLSEIDAEAAILEVLEGSMPPKNPLPASLRMQLADELRSFAQ